MSLPLKSREENLEYVPSPAILRVVKYLSAFFFFFFQNALERTWNAGTIHRETVNHYKFL